MWTVCEPAKYMSPTCDLHYSTSGYAQHRLRFSTSWDSGKMTFMWLIACASTLYVYALLNYAYTTSGSSVPMRLRPSTWCLCLYVYAYLWPFSLWLLLCYVTVPAYCTSFHAPTVLLRLRYSTWALRYSTPGYVSACLPLSSTPSAQSTFFYVMRQRLPSSSPLQPHPLHSLSMPTLTCGRIIYVYSFPTQALMAEMCAWQPFTHQTGTTFRLHLHFSWTFLQLLQQNCQSSEQRFQDRTLSTTYVSQGNMWNVNANLPFILQRICLDLYIT